VEEVNSVDKQNSTTIVEGLNSSANIDSHPVGESMISQMGGHMV
jgi:hypothetical protein